MIQLRLVVLIILASMVFGGIIKDDSANSTISCLDTEVFSTCVNPCQATCERPIPPRCEFLVCNKGCVCAKGYIQDRAGGKCIKTEACEEFCASNQSFLQCGSACPNSCQQTDPLCTDQCVIGCFCNESEGFLLDEASGRCVRRCDLE